MLRVAAVRGSRIGLPSFGGLQTVRKEGLYVGVAQLPEALWRRLVPESHGRNLSSAAANEAALLRVEEEPAAEVLAVLIDSPSDASNSENSMSQSGAAAQEHELGPEGHSESTSEFPSDSLELRSKSLAGVAEKAAAAAVLPRTKPIFPKQNQELELVCESLAYGGAAVCKVPETGFVLMCNGALPGERLLARVMRKKRSMAQATKIRTLEPPPNLVEPPCQHATECGGCKTQNWAYEAQVAEKQKQARVGVVCQSFWLSVGETCE